MNRYIRMALITVGVMFVANQLAAMNPQARRLLKGSNVVPVEGGPSKATVSA